MKILMAQLNYQIGNTEDNTQKIIDVIQKYGNDADLIVFSELCVTGYYPKDLLYEGWLFEAQNKCLDDIKEATKSITAGVVIGYIKSNPNSGKPFFNSLGLISNGSEIFSCNKQLLPTYNIFDEARWFEPGSDTGVIEFRGQKLGLLVCEDGWEDPSNPLYKRNPIADLKRESVDTIISINASPGNIGKQEERYDLVVKTAKDCNANMIYVNQIGGMDDIVFDGGSFAINADGDAIAQSNYFEEDVTFVDLGDSAVIEACIPNKMEVMAEQIKLGLVDYCRKTGFKKVAIGCSGGIDSGVTVALAAWALGPENVTAITMPSQFSSTGSWKDSEELCSNLGVKLYNLPIRDEFDLNCRMLEETFGNKPSGLTQENIQARSRGKLLMAYSNEYGDLILSCSNKSENSVGFSTIYGDSCGGLNLLGDVYKCSVYALARYLNDNVFASEMIPRNIIEKEPSAELSPDQKDSDSLPPYPILDAILRTYIELDDLTTEQIAEDKKILANVDPEVITKVRRMVNIAEYKRQQFAPVIRVHQRAFGDGRQIPLTSYIP